MFKTKTPEEELIRAGGYYAELATKQTLEEELEAI